MGVVWEVDGDEVGSDGYGGFGSEDGEWGEESGDKGIGDSGLVEEGVSLERVEGVGCEIRRAGGEEA